ncbi:MAG: diacylglycerol kinase family lipid kinase [Kineosporiaceae bacterium]|nr:diacylglycerol kinase family lipid kinase [Kineosporiaceae bacterium]
MGSGGITWAVTVVVLGTVLPALGLAVRRSRRRRAPKSALAARTDGTTQRPHVAVVVNPTKITDLDAETAWLARRSVAHDLAPATWWQTTVDDPGTGMTEKALAEQPAAVLAYGGDGTVRAVAAGLAGTSTPLGILPAGTGNLLARNLSLPLTDLDAALDIALGTRERRVDVARVEIDHSGEDHDPVQDIFCVMAGIGFDAEVMASVGHELKQRVGWWAYILAGTRKLSGPRVRVAIKLDDHEVVHRWVRSVLVGNCGELIGGFPLMPDAELDDGWLDLAVVAPRGVVGWGAVIATVLTRSRRGHPVVQHLRARTVEIRAEHPLHVQLDGDAAGTARVLRASADPLALTVRC